MRWRWYVAPDKMDDAIMALHDSSKKIWQRHRSMQIVVRMDWLSNQELIVENNRQVIFGTKEMRNGLPRFDGIKYEISGRKY